MGEKTILKEDARIKVKKPKMYHVYMHNDDYTTMDFVVDILIKFFNKTPSEATKIMLDVHKRGMGLAGTYPYDIAVTKISQVHKEARENGFPLKLSLKEE
ncbi:ATP-dependent Clp protease adaptor ClpS [Clostridium sp. SYSU_GA19001]|uniref:ATP-dependent Clp protease adaptor ClpS n=1 Tax=Clostridium caldaquaticum TaxID=2940653 RepID=UPI0020775D6C|nr:ATP-dependent Clp protease adaptor ClpS [Clostridium caldaquaticum]MCM8711469.1 ATP-dependent Clp protease adaptor ClpS [Clostridium caldaquaticum]